MVNNKACLVVAHHQSYHNSKMDRESPKKEIGRLDTTQTQNGISSIRAAAPIGTCSTHPLHANMRSHGTTRKPATRAMLPSSLQVHASCPYVRLGVCPRTNVSVGRHKLAPIMTRPAVSNSNGGMCLGDSFIRIFHVGGKNNTRFCHAARQAKQKTALSVLLFRALFS